MASSPALLAIGDVHLGTRCCGVPERVFELGVDPASLSPAAALEEAVEFAIKREVAAVVFAGDVVENTNARFEAIAPLESNVRRLIEKGIDVIAVAGNHDVEALPRLAALIDRFTFLGAEGLWKSRAILKDGETIAEVVGWSFGEKVVRHSPVAALLAEPLDALSPSVPRIGLLHGDLNATGGKYAPFKQSELDNTGYDAWLLGHIHKPSLQALDGKSDSKPCGYLGSLIGLDPTETGLHGPWLVELPGGREIQCQQISLSPLRWENLSVSVDGLKDVEDVPDQILREAEGLVRRLQDTGEAPMVLGLRVDLIGANEKGEHIRRGVIDGDWSASLVRSVDDTVVFVNKISDAMGLYVDLDELAKGDDPAALMAKRVLILERGGAVSERLLEAARTHLRATSEDI